MRLAEKAVVLTSTGRQTTPFPSVGIGSPRRVNLTVERIKKWLMQNALDEARSRGDEFNARQFEANLNRASQADLDSAENYLFNPDFIFENPPKILKDMGENMGISKTETTIEEPTISKEETVKSDPTEIDTSNWIVERLPQGEGQKRKGIIKAGVWDVSIGKLQIRKTREYPENISDADIISKVAELELRDKLNKPKYEPPTAEELEEEKRLEEIAQAEYEKEESERIEQEKAEKRQREEEDEKLQSIGDKITTFLDSKGDAVRYRDHGSKLSRSAYFEIDINPIYEDGEIVDYNDSVKVRISDHTLPPTYGRDNGYADFEFGIRNQADPEFYGEDPQPLFDYINKKIEQSKLDKETQESLNTEETAVSDDITDKNISENEEPVKKEDKPSEPENVPETLVSDTQGQGRQLILTRDNVKKVVDAVTSNWKFSNAADGHIQITPKNNIDVWSSGERAAIVSAIEGAGMSIAQNALKSSGKYFDENKNAKNIIRVISGQEQFSPAGFIDEYVSGISKYKEKSDVENMSDNVDEQDQATKKQDRGRKMQDVGEKLEGKRALQDKLGKSSYPEKAKEIIEATRPKNAFKFQQRDGQTSGIVMFAMKLQENLYDYSEYLKSRGIIRRSGSRYSKMYGWEQQLANIFADGADIDGADIGPRNSISESIVIDHRQRIIEAAEEYVELAERLNYMFENSYNIEQFKAELSNAFEDGDFKALFDKYAKTYGLKRDIFTDSYYSPFARITDETDIKKQNRVEKKLSRPKLEKVERVNLKDHRKGRDVSETEFMNTFGFRGVEFGEWVSSKEGQAHVNLSYDALMDLADRLKINPKHISLGGKLGFAFGSRGKGEHSAHFEPTNNVINLTKTRGDGAVAHEWFHALDYNLRQSGADGVKFMDMAYKTMTHKPINDIDNYLKNRLIDNLNGTSYWQRGSRNKLKLGVMGEAKYTIEQYTSRPFEFMFRGTDFKREGDSLGKDYWGTPIELIARSWESYIHDTLDGTNQYLVNDWVADGFVSKENGYRGTIYPVGDERKSFNDFFNSFMQNIEFNDTGVKVKEGAILPIQADVAKMIEKIQSFEGKLGDMLKEIRDGSIQQTEVQTSIPDGNVGESAEDVSGTLKDEDIERLFGRKSSGSSGDVQENTGSSERAGDENGGGSSSIGDRIQRDDTVPERVEDSAPTFSAKGHNHKISIGSLDEKRSPKKKAQDNIEIIKTVKSIEKDNRAATPEEQEMLAKYTGWGSLKNAFPKSDGVTIEKGWEGINSSLKSLLSEKEYNEARSSIQYAHYTSEIVVRSMWKAMQKLGLSNGNIFEPGMGIGNFLGMIPDGMDVQYSGLELDPMSARIASILYPESSVRNADFISARYGENTFSAAIGNPPFDKRIIYSDPKYKSKKLSIHNYFFAKTLDMVAPGGVLAFVTSRYSLDAIDSSARKMMSESADLIGAIRLPNTAFKTNANTEVVTDIIFLRKRLSGEESNGIKWLDTIDMDIVSDDGSVSQVPINEYYHNNPEMILGDISLTGSMHRKNEFTVNESASHNLQEQLDEAISRLPDNVVTDIQKSEYAGIDMTPSEEKEGAYYIKDGTLMQVQDGVGSPVPMRGAGTGGLTKDSISKIKALIPVRDALRKSMDAMVKRDDKSMRSYQKELKKAYDSFVKKYGPITKSETDSRAATVGQIESARNDVRNDFIAAGEEFNEGDIDLSHLIGKVNPETGKKYTDSQIGAIRQSKRDQIISNGGVVDEGDFNPDDVPPNVVVKYPNLDPFMDDPEAYNLMMLEDYNEEEGKAKTTSVFEKNIVSEVKLPELKTPVDALNRSLVNRNGVDIEYMSQELGQDREKIATELEDLGLIYRLPNPEGGNIYVYSEEYLSGYVKDKLRYAKQLEKYDPYYKKNVMALEAVQPRDIPASDINTQIGAPYFDENLMIDFMQESLGISANITRIKSINKWDVTSNDRFSPENTTQWGTSKRPATEIVESLLMRKNIQVTSKDPDGKQVVDVAETQAAQDKARLIQEKFNDWIWKSGHSDRIFREYNDEYNNIVPRVYNGEHITTSISPDISLKDHQKNVVWRVLQSGNTYIAHAVGAGKTISSSSIAMEMRRIGSWRKPMIVVPNHMLAQFAGEFKLAYPQSNIIIADENKFHKDKRNRFVASVAKGDFDAVIMTFSSFAKTPVSKDFEIKMLDEQLAKYRMALQEANKTSGKRSSTAANVEKQIKKMEERISRLKRIDVDQSFYFEQLGVDAIIVDEAHNYRKLSFATNQGNMKGVSPIGSKSSWDLYAKTRYLDTIHPSRNLVMMSGTPLTNTLAEVFTMQRFMNERALISKGIDTFDAWSSSFASAVSAPERQPSGAYKTVTRLSDFKNLGPLSQMTRQFMDVVTSEQLGALVDRPTLKTGSMIIKTTKPTDAYLAFQKYLDHRTKAIQSKRSNEKGSDNILNIIGEGRMAAIDMRMIDPTLPEQKSKLTDMVDNVYKIWKDTSGDSFKVKYSGDDRIAPLKGGVQLIFSDLGVHAKVKNGVSFSPYSYIKRKLISMGVPAKEIAFISDYETVADKNRLQNMMRNGEIRILIGSTRKMGTGLNVQNRLKAIHNLDAPWIPADLEQRNGRGLRQGNQYKEIEIYGYGTEGTYDSTMWQLLERKAGFISKFLKGDSDMSSMSDIEETDMYRLAKAMTSGDPRVLKQAELQGEVETLSRQSRNFTDEQVKIKSSIASKISGISRAEDHIKNIDEAKSIVKFDPENFLMTVMGKPYSDRSEAAGALDAAVSSVKSQNISTDSSGVNIGSIGGFNVKMFSSVSNTISQYEIFIDHPAFSDRAKSWSSEDDTFSASGTITRLMNNLNGLDKAKENSKRIIEMNKREIGVLESQKSESFPKQKELESKRSELIEINNDLQNNAPVEISYDEYPIEYWEDNKMSMSPRFSIVGDDEYSLFAGAVKEKSRNKVIKAISRQAKKLGIDINEIELFGDISEVFNIPTVESSSVGGEIQGFYYNNLIYISMKAGDYISTLNHEVIHKLRAAGAFTKQEWSFLEGHAKDWREKYNIEENYKELDGMTETKMDEEAIAHAFQDYSNKGFIERLRGRIRVFFKMLHSVLTGDEFRFETVEDVFEAVLGGYVSKRKFSTDTSAMTMFQSAVPDVKNDAAMFSLFGNVVGKKLTKKDQLDYAMSSLDDVRGLDRDMRPNIKVISTYLLHPRQIASLFEKFAPVFMAVTNMMQRRDKIVHELTKSITPYNHLPKSSKDKVNAVLELGRLSKMSKKTIIKNDDGSVTAINSGINAALSKDGDRITLTKEETDAYVGVRNTMNLALDLYIEVILEEYGYIEKGIKTSEQLRDALESETDLKEIGRMQDALFMIEEIKKSKRAGYVPFTRWGQIGVTVHSKTETVEDENGNKVPKLLHFERIELGVFKGKKIGKNSEVIEAVNRLKEKYGDDADISSFEMKDMTSVKGRIRMRDLDLLAASSDMSRDDYETLREMLQDEVKRRGFRAHFFKAEDVPGYNPDLERALNDYVVSISGHLARRLHQSKVEDTLKPLAESGQERLYKYASNYIDYVTDPIEEYGALRQMGFMWYLAGNVASGLTNATQPIMVTAPWFKAMFSHGNILKNMSKAYKDASMMLTVKSGTDMFDFSKAPDDIKSILKEADEDGLFLPKQTFDAMSIAYTNSQHLRGLNRKARTMMDVMSLTFSIPERMNRLVTYISAYRMAIDPDNKKKIMSFIANDQLGRASLVGKEGKEFAMAFAEYAVYSTQLQMGRLNRPTISRGLGTLPLQFMSFPMQMMELMYRLAKVHGGQKGQSIAFMIMAVVFMSGLKGIPFEDDLQDLIEGAYKRLTRTDIDIDTEVRGLLSKAVGPKMAEAIMKGVPAAFLNVDMSSRLGFGNLVPTDGNDMLGVWWDMLYTKPTTAMTSLARGDTAQAISDLSPALIKNPLQAYIWSQDGVRSSSTGDTVIIPDDLTKTDIGLKALGFTSGDVSRERERIYARRRADNAVNDLRSDYYDRLARAYAGRIIASRKGDSERQQLFESQIQAINEQKTAYNADKPLHRQIIIHDPSLKKRILEELQGAKANKPRKQSRDEAQKIDEIYGN